MQRMPQVAPSVVLLLSLLAWLPSLVEAAVLNETLSYRAHAVAPYESATFDASVFTNLRFAFDYDATTLDFGPPQDSFSYGYRASGDEFVLGTVLGLAGSTTDEVGSISVDLPESAALTDFSVFVRVTANSSVSSDKVELRNLIISGDEKPVVSNDLCPNLDGVQEQVPAGYALASGECVELPSEPVDQCSNVDGIQEQVPAGYELVGDVCLEIQSETDICPNVDGVQISVPEGLILTEGGDCVAAVVENPPPKPSYGGGWNKPKPKECPRGFSKWIDRFPGGYVWRADDVYKAVILMGGPVSVRANRDRAHYLYIPGPTEVGDRYYRRFHKIELVCVKG